MREQPDYKGPAYGELRMHHTLSDLILPVNKKVTEFQTIEYFLVVLLRVYESREAIPHIHAVHILILQVSGVIQYFSVLFRVIS